MFQMQQNIAAGHRQAPELSSWPTSSRTTSACGQLTLTAGGRYRRSDLILQGDLSDHFLVIRCGWVCLYTILDDGRRSNIGFALPGDVVGLSLDPEEERNFGAVALTDVSFFSGRNDQIADACYRDPGLNMRLCAHFRALNHQVRNQLVTLASRSAEERVAHLVLTLALRLLKQIPAPGASLRIPLTQQEIGDALGLTSVHVNRMLRQLRSAGILNLQHGVLTILDPDALVQVAHVDPDHYARYDDVLGMEICGTA